jgi:argininosuccinate lyase
MSRFSEPQDPTFQALNSSIGFDWRLAPYDIEQSLAHVRMLGRQAIIEGEDVTALENALETVRDEVSAERFEFHPEDEDVHMAIERRVTELAGTAGGKLHTARSRNDQVATDVAMFVRAHTLTTCDQVKELMAALVDVADRHIDWPMPGYTHLQRAQPVYLGHHLLAHFWRLARDHQRFQFCLQATARLPLGTGALAGVNFDTDREWVARELGFEGVVENSMDAVSNRDFVLDFVGAAATCGTHLSQLGAELVLWSTDEFGFCELADAFASGSSIMPQKKNPDAAELLRAKAPRIVGRLVGLHGALHGLPLTYNKDLQEDKEALFDAADTIALCLSAATGMLGGVSFNRERLEQAASDEMLAATDVADLLVKKGVPFREAHGIVATLVRTAVDSGRNLSGLTDEEIAGLAPVLADAADFRKVLSNGEWLESKRSRGGTSLDQVRAQLAHARALVA